MWKKRTTTRWFLLLTLLLFGCEQEAINKDKELLRINNCSISKDEVAAKLKYESDLNSNFYLVPGCKKEFLNDLIQSQLLIQEAKRQKIDEREVFRQTIQRYWESTLIRDLLEEKGRQFRNASVVTEQEIIDYYNTHKEFLPPQPMPEMQKEIADKIVEQKVGERLASWIKDLKKDAKIYIYDKDTAAEVNDEK